MFCCVCVCFFFCYLMSIFWCISHRRVFWLCIDWRPWAITQVSRGAACDNGACVLELNRLWSSLNDGKHSFQNAPPLKKIEREALAVCEIALQNEACLHRQQKQILTIGRLFRCNISSLPLSLASDIGRAVGLELLYQPSTWTAFIYFFAVCVRPLVRGLKWDQSKHSDWWACKTACGCCCCGSWLTPSLAFRFQPPIKRRIKADD